MPVESFRVRIGEEIDWADINAVYVRDDSTKGNTNPKSQHANQKQQQQQQQQPSNSQRFSGNLKPKAPIIALPNKMQLGTTARRPPNARMANKKKRSGFGRKSAVPPPEPGSPKVSCFGKVLLDGDRDRSQHRRPDSATSSAADGEGRQLRSSGCLTWLARIFLCGRPVFREREDDESSAPPEKIVPWSVRVSSAAAVEGAPEAEPPGLGAMRRFSSGRRPQSWGGDEDSDGKMRLPLSAPLDREGDVGRRSVG